MLDFVWKTSFFFLLTRASLSMKSTLLNDGWSVWRLKLAVSKDPFISVYMSFMYTLWL